MSRPRGIHERNVRQAVRHTALVLVLTGCATSGTTPPASPPPTPAQPATGVPARTTPPELGPVKALVLPQVVERTLPNGLRVLVVEHHELPVADFVLVIGTGSEADPAGRPGLASMAAALLDDGTRTRSALQIAEQTAFLGIGLGTGSGWDAARISLHTPTAQLDSAFALFADVALNPAFAQDELDRLREQRLTQLLQQADRPPTIASEAFSLLVFGTAHPYGRPLLGNPESVRAINRDELRQFYQAWFRPNNATLIAVGDLSAADVERRALAAFGAWQRAAVPRVPFPATASPVASRVYLIDKPGAPQSSFRLGGVGAARSTADYFPLLVMNTVLGGAFTSRLNANLRETRGYTYGASSGFGMRREAGPFTASAEIVATKTDSALVEFMKELRAIREPVPADELEKAKRYLMLQLPSQFETTRDIAAQLVALAVYGLPLDYFTHYASRIEAVTQQEVQRVAQRYIRPDEMSIVIVGDRATIEPGVRAVFGGPVEIRDLSGRSIPR